MEKVIYDGKAPSKEIFQIFSETISELIDKDKDVTYIDADLMSSMRSKELWKKYPDNVFNTGIQEANMIGVAAGMFLYGRKVYVHSFAPFASRRCFDQIYESIGYARKGIRIIASEPGICACDNGGTHMTFEDIAMMRAIPGAVVVDVSDGKMFKSILEQAKDLTGVIYVRTPRRGLSDIYADGTEFCLGEGKKLTEGTSCTIVASGIMLSTALQAEQQLRGENITVDIIDPVTIKPLDIDLILESVKKTGRLVTVENHSINGGLGGAIAEQLSELYPVCMKRIGIRDEFGEVGSESYLRNKFNLTAEEIIQKVKELVKK